MRVYFGTNNFLLEVIFLKHHGIWDVQGILFFIAMYLPSHDLIIS